MSVDFVQAKANGSGTSTTVVTLDAPPTAGNFLAVVVNNAGATFDVTGITDSAGNTYQQAGTIQRGTDDNFAIWYAYNVATAAAPFSVTVSTVNQTLTAVIVQEWSGVHAASDPLSDETGKADNTSGAGNDFAVGPLTPADVGSLCLVGINIFGYDALPAALDHYYGLGYDYIFGGALSLADPYTATFSFGGSAYHVAKMALFRAPYSTWVDVADFVEQEIPSSAFPSGAARVRVKLWTGEAGVTVQARLYDVTNSVSVGESDEVASTTPTDATFAVALTSGTARYRLQVTSDTADTDLFAMSSGVVP